MPVYVYECASCGQYDALQGINDKPHDKCSICGNSKVRRVIGRCNFICDGPSSQMRKEKSKQKSQKMIRYADRFPEQADIEHKLYKRRKTGKPIDGQCFKDAGEALKEARRNLRKPQGLAI